MSLTTVTSRKWAAQEMHGSWLRTACSQRHCRSSSLRSSPACDDATQVGLDGELVLRGGRHDAGLKDRAVLIDLVAVEEQAPRRLGHAGARRRAGLAPRSAGGSGGS